MGALLSGGALFLFLCITWIPVVVRNEERGHEEKNNISDIYGTDGTLCCLFWDGTGNGFRNIIFLVWIGLAVLSFLFGYSIWKSFWKKVPRLVKGICIAVVAVGLQHFSS